MSLCPNCKTNIPKYKCEICNCSYCLRCDSYIHSFPSKRIHLRKYITINSENSNYKSYYPYYSNDLSLNQMENNNLLNTNNYNEKEEEMNIYDINQSKEENDYYLEDEKQNIFFYSQTKYDKNKDKMGGVMNDNENKLNDSIEKEIYSKKISNLGTEIIDAKETFENKIEDLNEYFQKLNENQKIKMEE